MLYAIGLERDWLEVSLNVRVEFGFQDSKEVLHDKDGTKTC